MPHAFDPEILTSVIGGRAVLETPRLSIHSAAEAAAFVKSYGYDLEHPEDREELWTVLARAVTYIRTQLLKPSESIPVEVSDRKHLKDFSHLLLMAAGHVEGKQLVDWACALLRVMHVIAQLKNDLFTDFSNEIQAGVTAPYEFVITRQADGTAWLGHGPDKVNLVRYDVKAFKDSDSAITKLLAKPEEVAFGLMDKVGVRFVTNSIYDAFATIRFLVRHQVINPANIIANQSNNTLYPTDLFVREVAAMPDHFSVAEVDRRLRDRLDEQTSPGYLIKQNSFTSRQHGFIKFISRQLIRVKLGGTGRDFSFFYPYEVQILDRERYARTLEGEASHENYKARQRERARERTLSPRLLARGG